MPVKLAVFALNKAVEQVDRDDEERRYHDCDQRARQKVDACAGKVDFFAGARLESVFLKIR